jgi:chemotaxis protein methyltransferase WspC
MSGSANDALSEVRRLLRERAGIEPDSFGQASLAHALRDRVSRSGAESPDAYVRRLGLDAVEFQAMLEDLVVPETWFFRDGLAFRQFSSFAKSWTSSQSGTLRVLSVACSTGEEVYSLAIMLREAGISPDRYSVLGADISQRSLEFAGRGAYPGRSFRDSSESQQAVRDRWFRCEAESWQVRDELREGIAFTRGNLASPEFLAAVPPFHVVFCRNVMIYFHDRARRIAVGHLHRLLSSDGTLFSAPAEARIFQDAGFQGLGGECPFAFRHRSATAEEPRAVESAKRPPGALRPSPKRAALPAPAIASPAPRESKSASRPATASPETADPPASLLETARREADNGRLDEANSLCDQLLAKGSTSAEIWFLKGLVRQAQGQWNEAQRILEKVLYLEPKHYEALVQLMRLAERSGDDRAAANYRRRAQQVAPREAK